jgi:hypothetical protein
VGQVAIFGYVVPQSFCLGRGCDAESQRLNLSEAFLGRVLESARMRQRGLWPLTKIIGFVDVALQGVLGYPPNRVIYLRAHAHGQAARKGFLVR